MNIKAIADRIKQILAQGKELRKDEEIAQTYSHVQLFAVLSLKLDETNALLTKLVEWNERNEERYQKLVGAASPLVEVQVRKAPKPKAKARPDFNKVEQTDPDSQLDNETPRAPNGFLPEDVTK